MVGPEWVGLSLTKSTIGRSSLSSTSSTSSSLSSQRYKWNSNNETIDGQRFSTCLAFCGRIHIIGGQIDRGIAMASQLPQHRVLDSSVMIAHHHDGVIPKSISNTRNNTESISNKELKYESWPNPIQPRRYGATVNVDDRYIYMFGGQWNSTAISSCERFDDDTRTWQSLPDMPIPRHQPAALYHRATQRIYVMGSSADQTDQRVDAFDIIHQCWISSFNEWCLPKPIIGPSCTLVDDQLVVVCGGRRSYRLYDMPSYVEDDAACYALNLNEHIHQRRWYRLPSLPIPCRPIINAIIHSRIELYHSAAVPPSS
jgi:hypothetical protein